MYRALDTCARKTVGDSLAHSEIREPLVVHFLSFTALKLLKLVPLLIYTFTDELYTTWLPRLAPFPSPFATFRFSCSNFLFYLFLALLQLMTSTRKNGWFFSSSSSSWYFSLSSFVKIMSPSLSTYFFLTHHSRFCWLFFLKKLVEFTNLPLRI